MNATWPGVLDGQVLNQSYVDSSNRLADAAKMGQWDEVFRILDSDHWVGANQWRIGGRSWFAPLHQAAWLGAPVNVVEELVRRGAWRSLRNADGDRPIDIARARGHNHLLDSLAVREVGEKEQKKFAAWDRHLAEVIAQTTRGLRPVAFRGVPTEVVVLEGLNSLFAGYPGMFGGFFVSTRGEDLFVEASSRMDDGDGELHRITERGHTRAN